MTIVGKFFVSKLFPMAIIDKFFQDPTLMVHNL